MGWKRVKQQAKRKKDCDRGDKEKVGRYITGITSRIESIWMWREERHNKNVLGSSLWLVATRSEAGYKGGGIYFGGKIRT